MELDELLEMPLADADAAAHAQIEHHRAEMSRWREIRARRLAAEYSAGRSVAEIASELGLTRDVVHRLVRFARTGVKN